MSSEEKVVNKKQSFDAEKQITDKDGYADMNSGPCFGVRHTQVLLLFFLVCFGYCMRTNLSVAIVAMTDNSTNPDFTTYDWDDKSVILSSFFWGYVVPQVGAGQLAKNFGARWLLITSMAVCSIFTILVPFVAGFGSYAVMICRVVQGFAQGFFYPCVHNLLSKWVPLSERTRMGTFVYAGGPFGNVLAMPLTGIIADSSLGWPSVFYIFGGLGLVWVVFYILLGSNSTYHSKSISEDEKDYIRSSISIDDGANAIKTPWKKIFTSLPVWSILIAHCGQNWGFWTLLTEIPTYMSHILNFDIKQNGMLSALPYFVLWLLSFVFGALSDYLINRKILSIMAARKITTTIGLVGPAIALAFLGMVGGSNVNTAIALLVVAVGINSATYCGYQVNHIDLAPEHAGTLMGLTNGAANIFSFVAPLSVQFIVTDENDPSQWKIVFWIAAVAYVLCAVFYIVFGSGDKQNWDDDAAAACDKKSIQKEAEANAAKQ